MSIEERRNVKHTGQIWDYPPRSRGQIVRRVCEALRETYGLPRHGNPYDPIDDLIFIILSNRTQPAMAQTVFSKLRSQYPSWDELAEAVPIDVRNVLLPAGLSDIKTRQILALLQIILDDFGDLDAEELWGSEKESLLRYLTSLPGVSDKVARCVMMYTLGLEVLPVDVHVHRVARRLGWTARKRADQSHDELESLVPSHRRYALHVGCVAHGRELCVAQEPRCTPCPLKRYCLYYAAVQGD